MKRRKDRSWLIALLGIVAGLLLGLWLGSQFLPNLSPNSLSDLNANQEDEYVSLIAVDYAQSQDLAAAEDRLRALDVPNTGYLVVGVTERQAATGASPYKLAALAELSVALGADEESVRSYLSTPTPIPPTPTDIPSSPTPAPATLTPTPIPVEPTSVPDTATPTAEPLEPTPTIVTETNTPTPLPAPSINTTGAVNVHGGPGTAFSVVASLDPGASAEIIAKNKNGNWWQIELDNGDTGWVFGQIVNTEGAVESIAVAENIPTPPPTPTPSAPPTATAAPKPAVDYIIKSTRLRNVGEHAQSCRGGDHNIFVYVVDKAGQRLNGVRVREVFTNMIHGTGDQGKGDGVVQYDTYRGGGGQVDIVDEAGNRISELSRGMSADWPPIDLMYAAGYCNCKPHPDLASCQSDLENKKYLFTVGHYVYEVVFERTY